VEVAICAGPSRSLDDGAASVTMAYVLLVHLLVICPLIRLLSISMKERTAKRRDQDLPVLASMRRQGLL
jgi:hypothetical protein